MCKKVTVFLVCYMALGNNQRWCRGHSYMAYSGGNCLIFVFFCCNHYAGVQIFNHGQSVHVPSMCKVTDQQSLLNPDTGQRIWGLFGFLPSLSHTGCPAPGLREDSRCFPAPHQTGLSPALVQMPVAGLPSRQGCLGALVPSFWPPLWLQQSTGQSTPSSCFVSRAELDATKGARIQNLVPVFKKFICLER